MDRSKPPKPFNSEYDQSRADYWDKFYNDQRPGNSNINRAPWAPPVGQYQGESDRPWAPPMNQHGGWSPFVTPEQTAQRDAHNKALMEQWQTAPVPGPGEGEPNPQEQIKEQLLSMAQPQDTDQATDPRQMLMQLAAQRDQQPPVNPSQTVAYDDAGLDMTDALAGPPGTAGTPQAPQSPGLAPTPKQTGTDWKSLITSSLGIGLLGAGGNKQMQAQALHDLKDTQARRKSNAATKGGVVLVENLLKTILENQRLEKKKSMTPFAGFEMPK